MSQVNSFTARDFPTRFLLPPPFSHLPRVTMAVYNGVISYYSTGHDYLYEDDLGRQWTDNHISIRANMPLITETTGVNCFTQRTFRFTALNIPEGKSILLTLTFGTFPTTEATMQIFVGGLLVQTVQVVGGSGDASHPDEWLRKSRSLLLDGTGRTPIDIIIRPLIPAVGKVAPFYFYKVEWSVF